MFEVSIEENAFTYLYMMKSPQKSLNISFNFFYFFDLFYANLSCWATIVNTITVAP